METIETKVCRVCGRVLPISNFKNTRYGNKVSVCTECATNRMRENRQKRIDEQRRKVEEVKNENKNLRLSSFTPRELMEELKRRGYEGKLFYTETHTIDLSAL